MSRFWSHSVRDLKPYIPGEQPRHRQLVKLNTNESPYPPSPRVMAAIAATSEDSLRLYPDPESDALRCVLATRSGLEPNQVFVGNGSDEVLAHAFRALMQHGRPVAFPDITYSFYPVWARLFDLPISQIPLREDFTVEVDDFNGDFGGVLLPNPNAPTSIALGLEHIRRLLRAHPDTVVVIDEAYVDYGVESAVSIVPEFDNLLVVQTMSKSRGLAGLRVGMAFGHPDLIEGLNRVKNSFNSYPLDAVAQQAAVAAVEDEAWFSECCSKVVATRTRLAAELNAMGFAVLPSSANFLFVRHPGYEASDLFEGLRKEGVIVRYFRHPRIDQFLRISIGTDEQCERLLAVLSDLLDHH